MSQGQLQQAYLLHSRPYRETSLLLEVFTKEQGKVALIAKGVRGKKSNRGSMLQLFSPMLIGYTGRSDLQTLISVEPAGSPNKLVGHHLYSGLYLNELLVRLLHRHDVHEQLFNIYQITINQLANNEDLEITLREFELALLDELGYGINFEFDFSGEAFDEDAIYLYHQDGYFERLKQAADKMNCFSGKLLTAIHQRNWQDRKTLTSAKQIIRMAFATLLGAKPLQSRALFRRKA